MLQDRLINFDIPDEIAINGEISRGFEIRRDDYGNIEIVSNINVEGGYEIETDGKTPGGFWGSAADTFSFFDADEITVDGAKVNMSSELIYNTGTGEFYTQEIKEETSFSINGTQGGVDIIVIDELFGTPNHSVVENLGGGFNTITSVTMTDSNGNVIRNYTSESKGYVENVSFDFILSDTEISRTYEGHSIPQSRDT